MYLQTNTICSDTDFGDNKLANQVHHDHGWQQCSGHRVQTITDTVLGQEWGFVRGRLYLFIQWRIQWSLLRRVHQWSTMVSNYSIRPKYLHSQVQLRVRRVRRIPENHPEYFRTNKVLRHHWRSHEIRRRRSNFCLYLLIQLRNYPLRTSAEHPCQLWTHFLGYD